MSGRILVAYASKYGATQGIAERIAATLRTSGQEAAARPVRAASDLAGFDGVIVGSAAYMGHWLPEATQFVRRNQPTLAARPVWLFSSGPLGSEATDAQGVDLRIAAEPKEIAELREAVHPRDHRVFFGALDPSKLGFGHRVIRVMPAGRALLPEGDFRDWKDVEAWAESIAHELTRVPDGAR